MTQTLLLVILFLPNPAHLSPLLTYCQVVSCGSDQNCTEQLSLLLSLPIDEVEWSHRIEFFQGQRIEDNLGRYWTPIDNITIEASIQEVLHAYRKEILLKSYINTFNKYESVTEASGSCNNNDQCCIDETSGQQYSLEQNSTQLFVTEMEEGQTYVSFVVQVDQTQESAEFSARYNGTSWEDIVSPPAIEAKVMWNDVQQPDWTVLNALNGGYVHLSFFFTSSYFMIFSMFHPFQFFPFFLLFFFFFTECRIQQ
eukprot:TRINITY_DN199491_c0_g1_i1.p1 TRINITY_DN199491_c0_g1~~TRINITY_DN199491_c0_g1_i1.p1  ORF type:complete len:266 (-),score=9.66 TRINITY_DN199491_c0_g1_i1:37-798(-)